MRQGKVGFNWSSRLLIGGGIEVGYRFFRHYAVSAGYTVYLQKNGDQTLTRAGEPGSPQADISYLHAMNTAYNQRRLRFAVAYHTGFKGIFVFLARDMVFARYEFDWAWEYYVAGVLRRSSPGSYTWKSWMTGNACGIGIRQTIKGKFGQTAELSYTFVRFNGNNFLRDFDVSGPALSIHFWYQP